MVNESHSPVEIVVSQEVVPVEIAALIERGVVLEETVDFSETTVMGNEVQVINCAVCQ